MVSRRSFALSLAAALVVAASAACGGSGGKATPTAGSSSQGQSFTVVAGTPDPNYTPPAYPTLNPDDITAIARGADATYVPYTDKQGRYAIEVPAGWRLETTGTNSMSVTLLGDNTAKLPARAIAGVYCSPSSTIDKLIASDQQVLQQAKLGNMTLDNAYDTTVAGLPATAVPWSGELQDLKLQLDHLFIYFQDSNCAWRIVMTTYPGVSMSDMKRVLDHMVATFRLTPAPAATP